MNDEIIIKLKDFISNHLNNFSYLLQHSSKYQIFLDFINEQTKGFDDLPFSTKVYWALNGIHEYPKCQNPNCGKELRHDLKCRPLTGYVSTCCSAKCGQLNPAHKEKLKSLSIEKYGVDHPSKSVQFKQKIRNTLSIKDTDFWQQANEKRKQTCLEKYGVDSVSKVEDIKAQANQTFANRTDEQRQHTIDQIKQTKLVRYGDVNYVNIEKIKTTRASFSQQKLDSIQNKRKQTCLEKYGVDSVSKVDDVIFKIQSTRNVTISTRFYDDIILHNEFVEPQFSREYYVEHSNDTLEWKCKKCGNIFSSKKYQHQSHVARCLKCFPLSQPVSGGEIEVFDFIANIVGQQNVIANSRKVISPQELDIYVPDKRLAIEYDGVYWHSENMGTSNEYHLNKTNRCHEQNIKLVHIFDCEWHSKKDIVQSRLKNMLGKYDEVVFARKCVIKEVDSFTTKDFLNDNHLQGWCQSKVSLGLFYNDVLVSLMTFGKPRFSKDYQWELLRFCNKLGYHVPGGASRLLKHFERQYQPTSLISFADRRWSTGNVYEKLGFVLHHTTKPNYWYWNYAKSAPYIENRMAYQKHKLKDVLTKFDESKTEIQNMFDNGYFRIFDCGNLAYVKSYS